MNVPDRTCILLKKPTYNRLRGVKNEKDTFDDVINKLLQTGTQTSMIKTGVLDCNPVPTGRNGATNPGPTGYDYSDRNTR